MLEKTLVVVQSHVKPPLVLCSFVHFKFKISLTCIEFVKSMLYVKILFTELTVQKKADILIV